MFSIALYPPKNPKSALNKRWEKNIRQLHNKKHRYLKQQFLVEGQKAVMEAMASAYPLEAVFGTKAFFDNCTDAQTPLPPCPTFEVLPAVLRRTGTFKTNDGALAIAKMPPKPVANPNARFTLLLDELRDPGNLGTILRIADWFAVSQIICTENTVDCYNAKVVAASMGSVFRTKCVYAQAKSYFNSLPENAQIFGAFVSGEDFQTVLPKPPFVLVIGNESGGIREETAAYIHKRVSIPKQGKAESLNAAVACGILCNFYHSV